MMLKSLLLSDRVLVVDLDGTLIYSDMLHETTLRLVKASPLSLFNLPFWLLGGKAHLKMRVAEESEFDPSKLPYNRELIEWLRKQKDQGRTLVLCTASDISIAKSIAQHLGFFDDVIASDGKNNFAGENKATILVKCFGKHQFDYVGNSSADIPVWEKARKGVVVNASNRVLQEAKACVEIECVFNSATKNDLYSWVKAFRLHQWMKNVLLFIPALASHQILSGSTVNSLLLAFLSFSLCASSVYLANDLLDLESDRSHPRKFKRPFASGDLQLWKGVLASLTLAIISFILSAYVNPSFTLWLGIYFVLTCFYSLRLKQLVLVDCLTLAVLYTLRIVAGSAAIGMPLSFWLLAFSVFLFLSLAFVKRFAELQMQLMHGKHKTIGRGYLADDASLIQTLGVSSGYMASLVLAFYLNSQKVVELYSSPEWIWGCVPVLIFWMSWIWLQANRGQMHDDPLVFAMKDKISLLSGLFFVTFLFLGAIL
jgi:4-hydroxybenzoate polyprenyltransferase